MAYNDTLNNCSIAIEVHNDTLGVKYISSMNEITDNFRIIKSDIPVLPDTNKLFCLLSKDVLQVSYLKENSKKPSVKLINVTGKTISVFDDKPAYVLDNYLTYELKINSKNIANGIYFLTIDDGENINSCKVVYSR
jgi:hypothetical protein